MAKKKKAKRKRRPIKLSLIVRVSYDLNASGNPIDTPLEERLEALAFECEGDRGDSGDGFGARDIGFWFDTLPDAEKFIRRLRKFRRVGIDAVEAVGWN